MDNTAVHDVKFRTTEIRNKASRRQ